MQQRILGNSGFVVSALGFGDGDAGKGQDSRPQRIRAAPMALTGDELRETDAALGGFTVRGDRYAAHP